MVLTNFELWAADGTTNLTNLEFENSHRNRQIDPFNTRAVPQLQSQQPSNLIHLSSNGYYGFSYINAAHELSNSNNNNNNSNNNNNTLTFNYMANDVNGMNIHMAETTPVQQHVLNGNRNNNAHVLSPQDTVASAEYLNTNATRCKKRFFIINENSSMNDTCSAEDSNVSAKRCRFDDDYAAQYCNDFFSLPSNQIATQSCLMDIEQQQQQHNTQLTQSQLPQMEEAMAFEQNNNNNNLEKFPNQYTVQQQQQTQHTSQFHNNEALQISQQQHPSPPQQLQHQQQHFQGHLHRANRDPPICKSIVEIFSNLPLSETQNFSQCEIFPATSCNIKCNKVLLNNFANAKHSNIAVDDDDEHNNVDDATLFAEIHGGCLHHFLDI